MSYQLNLREVTCTLSEALDYVGVDDAMHSKRVAYMAAEVARYLGWSDEEVTQMSFIGMLHDCGVSLKDKSSHLVNELDWNNANVHCTRGYEILKNGDIYAPYSEVLLHHHTHWNAFPQSIDESVRLKANLVYLVDRVDTLLKKQQQMDVSVIHGTLENHKGVLFNPSLVDAFVKTASKDSFWFYLEDESLQSYYLQWVKEGISQSVPYESVKEVAMMFASVVDAKCKYTSEHSLGVSGLSLYLAKAFGLPQETCEKVELAGLLHDLGKLRVEDAILNKPGPLSADERLKMNRHGFDSDIILRRVGGFTEIARLASMHHETLDAQGYPYRYSAEEIPFEARIIAVADIFQALIQTRPYHNSLTPQEAVGVLEHMVENNKVDGRIVSMLKAHLDNCTREALPALSLT